MAMILRRRTTNGSPVASGFPIFPALESSHAVAEVMVRAPKLGQDKIIIVNLSGRGDKGVAQVANKVGLQMPE